MSRVLGAAVIGLGIGKAHCEAYASHPNTKLLAVADLLDDRLSWARDKYHVDTYKDYQKILQRDDIDIVSVCTPDFTHAKITIEALEAGKHVMVEKPMALTLEDCDRMIEAARKASRKLSVDHCLRVGAMYATIKRYIEEGLLGDVSNIAIFHWRGTFLVKPGRWIQKRKFAGSMTIQEMCHSIDMIRWWAGDVSEVYATGNGVRADFDYEQTVFINLKFKNNALGLVSHTMLGFPGRWTVWVIGTKASIYGEVGRTSTGPISELIMKEHKEDLAEDHEYDKILKPIRLEKFVEANVIVRHVQTFIDSIIQDTRPLVAGEEGRKVVEICLAADLSMHTGDKVKLPLTETPRIIADNIAPPDYPYLQEE